MWLAFTDAHLKEYTAFASVNEKGINSRLLEQINVINQIRSLAKTHKVSNIFFLGDLFDSQAPTISKIVYNVAFYLVQSLAKVAHTWLLTGNHDIFLNIHIFTPFSAIQNTTVVSSTMSTVVDGVGVDLIPWGGIIPKINKQAEYCFGHFGLAGSIVSKVARNEMEVNPSQLKGYIYALCGHYHTRQQVSDNAYHIGAMMATSFSATTEDRGAWLIDPSTNKLEFIHIPSPKFYTIELETHDDIVTFFDKQYTDTDYFKIRLKNDNLNILEPKRNIQVEYDIAPSSTSELELKDPADLINIKEIIIDFINNSNTALDKEVLKTRAMELLEVAC